MRRVAELSADALDALPDRCRSCLFWELGAARPIDEQPRRDDLDELSADPVVQKAAWWASAGSPAGPPGRQVLVDGVPAGYASFAASTDYAPRRAPAPQASDDALLLATTWIEPEYRGSGLGRLLVQAAVKEAIRRDLRAVEAYGDRRHRDAACVLPCTWLLHEGFEVHREHPRYPLLRLDVRSVLRWAEPLEAAIEAAWARLAPRRAPEPSPLEPARVGSATPPNR